jgi:hypothetical protein
MIHFQFTQTHKTSAMCYPSVQQEVNNEHCQSRHSDDIVQRVRKDVRDARLVALRFPPPNPSISKIDKYAI